MSSLFSSMGLDPNKIFLQTVKSKFPQYADLIDFVSNNQDSVTKINEAMDVLQKHQNLNDKFDPKNIVLYSTNTTDNTSLDNIKTNLMSIQEPENIKITLSNIEDSNEKRKIQAGLDALINLSQAYKLLKSKTGGKSNKNKSKKKGSKPKKGTKKRRPVL